MATWPLQSNCPSFYGDPRIENAKWQSRWLIGIAPPWKIYFDGKPVNQIRVHRKCAESFIRILLAIWKRLGQSQAEIDRVGLSKFSGSYNLRTIRGSNALSMHAYGCAVDFDSANNSLGDTTPAMDRRVIEEFEREGWEWGGHWSRPDGMHFQAAWTRVNPARLGPMTQVARTTVRQLAVVSRKVTLLDRLRKFAAGIATAAGGVFTLDNFNVFQGWMGLFAGLGTIALTLGVCAVGYWVVSNYLLNKTVEDFDEGRYTPSKVTSPPLEYENAMDQPTSPVAG